MKITKLISRDVITVHVDQRLLEIQHLFAKHKFHHLAVVGDDGTLSAVLSDRDLLKATSFRIGTPGEGLKDLATLNKRVHQIATRKPISLKENSTLTDVVKIFHENTISCIPIVDNDNKPVGILSWRDIVKYLYQKIEQK